jgi:phosphomevalonate kinase
MDNKMISISVPGKLMLAGEWSVLQKGNPCIVASVGRYVSVTISKSDIFFLYAKDYDIKTTFQWNKDQIIFEKQFEKLNFVKKVLEVVFKYFKEQKITINTFSLDINSSEFLLDGKKLGLGSSAAVVVGVISAIIKFHGYYVEYPVRPEPVDASVEALAKSEGFLRSGYVSKKTIFKLACIAHFYAQGKVGSCFDVAASAFGCVLWYERFDEEWLLKQLDDKFSLSEIVSKKWPGLEINKIDFPKNLKMLVGYVGYSADTKSFVKKVRNVLQTRIGKLWCLQVNEVVIYLRRAFENNDTEKVFKLFNENRILLKKLSEMSGVELETKDLNTLIRTANECGVAAKFSGAGGGDCGIAFCEDDYTAMRVRDVWKENGIIPLDLKFN